MRSPPIPPSVRGAIRLNSARAGVAHRSRVRAHAEAFAGAIGLNKIARFRLDPRDARTDADHYELVGDDDGVFGCMSLLACHDVCPKNLPLSTQIAFVRRAMVKQGFE